jgi:hypothetical protein
MYDCSARPRPADGAPAPVEAALDARLLPALESLFRRVPAAGPPHAAAAKLLATLLPAAARRGAAGAGGARDAAAALTTLRKFLLRCSGLPEQDRAPARAAAGHAITLLEQLLDRAGGAEEGEAAVAVFAAAQLLPGLQAFVTSQLRAGAGHALAARLAALVSRATALHAAAPRLGLMPVLLAHGGFAFCASAAATVPAAPAPLDDTLFAAALSAAEAAADGVVAAAAAGAPAPGAAELPALLHSRLLPELQRALGALHQRRGAAAFAASGSGDSGSLPGLGHASSAASLYGSAGSLSGGGGAKTAPLPAPVFAISAVAAAGAWRAGSLGGLQRQGSGAAPPALARQPSAGASPLARADSGIAFIPAGGRLTPPGGWGGDLVRGGSVDSLSWMSSDGGDGCCADPELAALQGRLDATLQRLAAAALALSAAPPPAALERRPSGSADGGSGTPRAGAAPHTQRVSCEDLMASLRAAAAAATAAAVAVTAEPGSPAAPSPFEAQLPAALLAPRARGLDSAPDAASLGALAFEAGGFTLEGLSPEGSLGCDGPPAPARLPCASSAAAGPRPLPPAASRKLLRALAAAGPAVAKAAAAALAPPGAAPPAGATPGPDPQALPHLVPALAALRVGCWSAACATLTGPSEAAAPLKPCAGGCGAAVFCSRACANAAYGAHRAECACWAGGGGGCAAANRA